MPDALSKTGSKSLQLVVGAGRKVLTSPGEAWLLCRMAWWVGVLSIGTRLFSLPRALQLVAGKDQSGPTPSDPDFQERLARTIDLLLSADLLMFRPICWKRAAVLHRYLARNGTNTRIVFGVRNDPGGDVDGHAWLELDGKPILEKNPPEYVVTYRFPSTEPFPTQLTVLSHD